MLAASANNVTRIDKLITELWVDREPKNASATVQAYVYQLRKAAGKGSRFLVTSPAGYLLSADEQDVDSACFSREVERARAQLARGDLEAGVDGLDAALRLWRGPALVDVDAGPILAPWALWLDELRKNALEKRIAAQLRLGRHHDVIHDLTALVAEQPTHEGFQRMLMLGLYRAGRRADALRVFQRARHALDAELGLFPSPELCAMHQAILAADPSLDLAPCTAAAVSSGAVHCQAAPLPRQAARMVGRRETLASALAALSSWRSADAPILVVVGAPGSGKSAFGAHLAHQLSTGYPEGVLHAALSDPDSGHGEPAEILLTFLVALGMPRGEVPDSFAERVRCYRAITSGRRLLVFLDDVCDQRQVEALMPAGPGCVGVVASRRRLPVGCACAVLALQPLRHRESVELLAAVLGPHRVQEERVDIDRLIRLSGSLPLTLLAAAQQLEVRPHWSVGRAVERLGCAGDEVHDGLRRSILRSCAALAGPARSTLAVLAAEGRPLTAGQVAFALRIGPDRAEATLEELVECQLTEVEQDRMGGFRYLLRPPVDVVARDLGRPRAPIALLAAGHTQ